MATVKRPPLGATLGDDGILLNAIEAAKAYEQRFGQEDNQPE